MKAFVPKRMSMVKFKCPGQNAVQCKVTLQHWGRSRVVWCMSLSESGERTLKLRGWGEGQRGRGRGDKAGVVVGERGRWRGSEWAEGEGGRRV